MKEVQEFITNYEKIVIHIKKTSSLKDQKSIMLITNSLNNLYNIYDRIPQEYSYMVYNLLLIAKHIKKVIIPTYYQEEGLYLLTPFIHAINKFENITLTKSR